MKLYAWQPTGHGELSFFVAARTEEEAREAVEKYIAEWSRSDANFSQRIRSGDIHGWGTDYYELTVCEPGVVIVNNND